MVEKMTLLLLKMRWGLAWRLPDGLNRNWRWMGMGLDRHFKNELRRRKKNERK